MPKCKDDQDLNPNTNRCIKKGGKVWQQVFGSGSKSPKKTSKKSSKKTSKKTSGSPKGGSKSCKDGQERSPLTNRCVKIGGAAWKKAFGDGDVVIEKVKKIKKVEKVKKVKGGSSKSSKDCPPGKVESPTSGRCINVGGAAYNKAFGIKPSKKGWVDKKSTKKTKKLVKKTIKPSKGLGYVYGIYEAQYYESSKYDMRVLFLGDSHTSEYKCPPRVRATSAPDMIEDQIQNTDEPIDVFLEIPYIFTKGGSSIPVGGYMGDLYLNVYECFTWAKDRCRYPNLRAHYVDLRKEELAQKYFEFERWIVNIFFLHNWNALDEWETMYRNNRELQSILKTKASLVKFMKELLNYPKIQKQIDNINDKKVKTVIQKHINEWTTSSRSDYNINFSIMTWNDIVKSLNRLRNGSTNSVLQDNKTIVLQLYYSLASYSGVVMDAYTIARMFRTYRDVPGKYSGRAKDIIVYAGSQHTHRYQRVLKDLGFKQVKEAYQGFTAGQLSACTDLSHFPNPLFKD